jgi:hypothetical protein
MPRAALLSIHARVAGAQPSSWDDKSLVQVWGPRFSTYVVPARDHALFTLARHPERGKGRQRAEDLAARLDVFLAGRTLTDREAMRGVGVHNALRYASTTGRVLIRWDGARAPLVWTVPPPEIAPAEARRELARRYLHVFGPATPASFTRWAGVGAREGAGVFDELATELTPVRTPIGEGWILSSDESAFRHAHEASTVARLLPSGDAYWLLQGADRELLVPDATRRSLLWTPRVWPGALLLAGEIAGTWRRAGADLAIEPWRRLSKAERALVEAEAQSLPMPGIESGIAVSWTR